MSEPRTEYNFDSAVAKSLRAQADFEAQLPEVRALGIDALKRLIPIALKDTGQSARIARFLLGCYNGTHFPFDLTDLRGLDFPLHEDCLAVLKMDYAPVKELHHLIDDGPAIFEGLARRWAPLYANSLSATAAALANVKDID